MTTTNDNKYTILQHTLSNIPKDIVNIIDSLSQEYEKLDISFRGTIHTTDDDYQDTEYYCSLSKYKKAYKLETIYGEDGEDEKLNTFLEKKEVFYECAKLIKTFDYCECIKLGEDVVIEPVGEFDFLCAIKKCVDLIGKLYRPIIPIQLNNEKKQFILDIWGDKYIIQKHTDFLGKNMYSITKQDTNQQVCMSKKSNLIKYISCFLVGCNKWECDADNILMFYKIGKEDMVLYL